MHDFVFSCPSDLVNSDTEEENDDDDLQKCLQESLKTYEEEIER